jgi:hypothetical protein
MELTEARLTSNDSIPVLTVDSVTLVCIESRHFGLAEWSLKKSLSQIKPARTYLFTSPSYLDNEVDPRIELVPLTGQGSIEAYNRFVLRDLHRYIETDYVLVTQWDSFVYAHNFWSEQFLNFDYIGAPWPHHPNAPVGNGGFSLRSRRLLKLTANQEFVVNSFSDPEDALICHTNRNYLEANGMRFAPIDLALRFSFESALEGGSFQPHTFGFHGVWNFPKVITPNELKTIVSIVPGALLKKKNGYLFLLELLKLRLPKLYLTALTKRISAGGINSDTMRLIIRYFAKLWTQ